MSIFAFDKEFRRAVLALLYALTKLAEVKTLAESDKRKI